MQTVSRARGIVLSLTIALGVGGLPLKVCSKTSSNESPQASVRGKNLKEFRA